MIGYNISLEEELKNKIQKLAGGDTSSVKGSSELVRPVDHLEEFDEVIGMIELEVRPNIKITRNDFRKFYLNKWGWSDGWNLSNSGYIGIGTTSVENKLLFSN